MVMTIRGMAGAGSWNSGWLRPGGHCGHREDTQILPVWQSTCSRDPLAGTPSVNWIEPRHESPVVDNLRHDDF
jgi:hypothetical protein